jgi:hypothetical protein
MDHTSDEQEFLATLAIGDIVEGTVTGPGSKVTLDGFPARPLRGVLFSWRRLEVGERITAEVLRVDQGRALPSSTGNCGRTWRPAGPARS